MRRGTAAGGAGTAGGGAAAGGASRAWIPGPALRATDRDREVAVGVVQTAYTVGRLSREEHDARISRTLTAQTYAELDTLIADLPGRPAYPDAPVAPVVPAPRGTNGLAIAALVCGIAQPFTGMLTTIPAIALGHVARGQIRRTGDEGSSMATWGLVLGWAGLISLVMLVLAVIAIGVVITGSVHGF